MRLSAPPIAQSACGFAGGRSHQRFGGSTTHPAIGIFPKMGIAISHGPHPVERRTRSRVNVFRYGPLSPTTLPAPGEQSSEPQPLGLNGLHGNESPIGKSAFWLPHCPEILGYRVTLKSGSVPWSGVSLLEPNFRLVAAFLARSRKFSGAALPYHSCSRGTAWKRGCHLRPRVSDIRRRHRRLASRTVPRRSRPGRSCRHNPGYHSGRRSTL